MNRYLHMSEAEVIRLNRKADQAAAMRAYHQECADRAMADLRSGDYARFEAVWNALLESEQSIAPPLPVPAYIRPVKRWAGGPADLDAWYWDHPAY
jgi:hypothetical protein